MEVGYHEYDPHGAPEVDASSTEHLPELIINHDSTKCVERPVHTRSKDEETKSENSDSKGLDRRRIPRKRWLVTGASVLVIISCIAVIGGVIGSGQGRSGSDAAAKTSVTQTSVSTSKPTGSFGDLGKGDGNTVNDAWAYNGTSISSLTFSTTGDASSPDLDTSGTNYVVFYQHSNGDIRKAVHNNSQWHPSEFVTNDAYPGTSLTAVYKVASSSIRFTLWYYDRSQILQELRGRHGSSDWLNGTLGQLNLRSSETLSLASVYNGGCSGIPKNSWVFYHTGSQDEARVVYWSEDTDDWTIGETFPNVKPAAGFIGHTDVGVWRYYYVSSQTSQLTEMVCPDCCSNSSTQGWRQGLRGPILDKTTGSIAVANNGIPRMIYYLDPNGSVRELNNSGQYPDETWIDNESSSSSGDNTVSSVDPSSPFGPVGSIVFDSTTSTTIQGVSKGLHRGVSMSVGRRAMAQELWLFYEINGTNIAVQTRDSDAVGQWSQPTPIPVER